MLDQKHFFIERFSGTYIASLSVVNNKIRKFFVSLYEERYELKNFNTTMKKMLLSALAIATLAIAPAIANDVPITTKKLPAEAQKFLKENFSKNSVISATHDRDVNDNDYTVILDNGLKVEFDAAGKWESIKSKNGAIPTTLIPAKINSYISQHYPTLGVEKIEKKRYGYEVELTNDLDVKFDHNGKFIGLDD